MCRGPREWGGGRMGCPSTRTVRLRLDSQADAPDHPRRSHPDESAHGFEVSIIRDRLPALRNRAFFASDLILLPLCAVVAFAARYDGLDSPQVRDMLRVFVLSGVPLKVALLLWLGMYRRLWRYASVADMELLLLGAGACALVDILLGTVGLSALGLLSGRLS